jgi:hypothetical protein
VEQVNKAIIFNILLHSDIRVDPPGSDLRPKLKRLKGGRMRVLVVVLINEASKSRPEYRTENEGNEGCR